MTKHDVRDMLTDPSTSYWIKAMYSQLINKNPIDALNDLETLIEMLKAVKEIE